jgi:signal transduction histidine kinase
MSDRLYSLFGFNEAETLSTEKILSRIHPEDLIEYKTTIEEILSTKGGSTLEIRLQNQTKVSHILARVECDIAENGKIALVKGTVLDITEKKEAMINLQHSYQMVMEQNERLLNFSYIISHNLRSHSSNIQGILEHIKEVKSEEETREMFNLLEEVATSLNTNLQDLNEVVHIHKSTKGEAQELNLCEFITKSKTILKRDLKKHQLNIIQKVPEEASVWFNPAYLESILLNIISYAIKHRDVKKNSKIKLTFREDKNYKILQIEDNGIGIDLDTDKKHIFGMYKTFKDFKESKSISLFVNNNQMQAMGGKIEVKSNINEGSEFHLYFKK